MLLSHLIALGQRLHIAFVVRNWEKWIVLWLLKVKSFLELRFTHVYSDLAELVFQLRPFFVFVLTCEPNLVVSKALVVDCLLSKGFDQIFDGVCRFHLLLQFFLSLFDAVISPILHFYLVHVFVYSALWTNIWDWLLGLRFLVIHLHWQQFDWKTAGLWFRCLR